MTDSDNKFVNILRLFVGLPNFGFTTSQTTGNYCL